MSWNTGAVLLWRSVNHGVCDHIRLNLAESNTEQYMEAYGVNDVYMSVFVVINRIFLCFISYFNDFDELNGILFMILLCKVFTSYIIFYKCIFMVYDLLYSL